ncbi:MAG: CpaF family protein [Caldanaerobacter subterraneus]|nr:CpaF family protein [Caldanaerobacter subterraneus]
MSLVERSRSVNLSKEIDINLIIEAVRPQMLEVAHTPDFKNILTQKVKAYIEENFPHYKPQFIQIAEEVYDKMYGLGILEKYLKMEGVTDVLVFGTRVMYVKDGQKIKGEDFKDINEIRVIYERILASAGQSISYAEPSKDAELPDGSRVKVIIPPEALEPYVILRKHTVLNKSLDEIKDGLKNLEDRVGDIKVFIKRQRFESFSGTLLDYFKKAVKERKNIVVVGETGAGKTTFINALSHYIQPNHIIAVLEDTRELKLPLPYVFYLKTRDEREGAKAITYEDILYDSLRANPDRIILTEIRTPIAAYSFIHVLNSGHRGSMTTIHADNVRMALDKLEMLIKEFKPIDDRTIRRLIAKAADIIVFIGLEEDEKGDITGREIKEVAELNGVDEQGNYILDYKYVRW